MGELAIRVREIEVRFGRKQVLTGLDLDVPTGSATALLGRNGSGKSTLLRVLTGVLEPEAGNASVLGLDARRRGADVRRSVGHVADQDAPPPWMRVRDWLRFTAAFYPTWNPVKERELVRRFDLDTSVKVSGLSRGGREKVALTAALAHEPRLLLLDEPFSGIDTAARREVLAVLIDELAAGERTILFVSHSMADVERLADRIAILEAGKIAWHGAAEDLRDTDGSKQDLDTLFRVPASSTVH